jgi:hypothetical protein
MAKERVAAAHGGKIAADATVIEGGSDLTDWLSDAANDRKVAQTRLKASDCVIVRVTDGIYCQPGPASCELISNAWCADAAAAPVPRAPICGQR